MPPQSTDAQGGARKRVGRMWPPVAMLGLVAVGIAVFLLVDPPDALVDGGMCPVDLGTAHRAVYLIDARKPLDADLAELPGRLLERVTLALESGTELRVYALGERADAPRRFIGRICKTYANADLQVAGAKDQTAVVRDCDDLPSQISPELREAATGFCRQRATLRERIDAIGTPAFGSEVAEAYLVEAVQATLDGTEEEPTPDSVYVFSDMMQHADWYSHVDDRPASWRIEEFERATRERGDARRASFWDLRVTVFYLPRTGLTDEPGMELLHKRFWRAFFDEAHVTFRNQPASRGYGPLALDVEQGRVAEVLDQVADREAEVAAAERRLAAQREAERQQHEERLAELDARERALEERLADLERQPDSTVRVDDDPLDEESAAAEPAPVPVEVTTAGTDDRAPEEPVSAAPGTPDLPPAPDPQAQFAEPTPAAAEGEPPPAAVEGSAAAEEEPSPTAVGEDLLPAVPEEPLPLPVHERVPPIAVSDEAPPPVAVAEQAPPTQDTPDLEACPLAHEAGNVMPSYPSRRYLGVATVVVSFDVDDSGRTVDETITVVRSRSSVERAHLFDRFGDAAVAAVRDWEFASATDADCRMAQRTAVPIEFRVRR